MNPQRSPGPGDRPIAVTLSGVRSRTHLVHVASYVRHLLDSRPGRVVVQSLGTGGFLGRTTVTDADVAGFLPSDPRLQVHASTAPGSPAPGRNVDWVYLAVGAPGIKPWLRMAARHPLHRPRVVVVDEGLGTYGTWRTRRDAWRRQGGGPLWPTVRALAVTGAGRLLTDERWALYLPTESGAWRLNEHVAAEFRRSVPVPASRSRAAIYLAQPWVAMGLWPAEDFLAHLHAVRAAADRAGLEFAVRPHPADPDDAYRGLPVSPGRGPAELDPEVVAAHVVLGATSTALLNLAAIHSTPAVRVTHPRLDPLDRELGPDQRSLLQQYVPAVVDVDRLGAALSALD